jgi:hypothetical protein
LPSAPDPHPDLPIGKSWRRLLLQAIKSNELRAKLLQFREELDYSDPRLLRLPLGGLSGHPSLVPDALEERA